METEVINNTFYEELGSDWYDSKTHPIALLRAENRTRIPYVQNRIEKHFGKKKCRILDIGCGAGFLSNALALSGHSVTAIDLSENALNVGRKRDETRSVDYKNANGMNLPFAREEFDVVLAMDFLEHIEEPAVTILESAKVLKPKGLFFFHTFNRNLWSWFVVIKGVEWCLRNAPENMHVLKLFIKPSELKRMCEASGMRVEEVRGFTPKIDRAFWKMVFKGVVEETFAFKFTKSLRCGYVGFAQKN